MRRDGEVREQDKGVRGWLGGPDVVDGGRSGVSYVISLALFTPSAVLGKSAKNICKIYTIAHKQPMTAPRCGQVAQEKDRPVLRLQPRTRVERTGSCSDSAHHPNDYQTSWLPLALFTRKRKEDLIVMKGITAVALSFDN